MDHKKTITRDDEQQLLSLRKLATMLDVGTEFLRTEVKRGALPATRLGRRGILRFKHTDIARYLDAHTAGDAQEKTT